MAVPPHMSSKIADHYASTGQTELAAQQRQSSENAGKTKPLHQATQKKGRYQDLSKLKVCLCGAVAVLTAGIFFTLGYQRKNMSENFCPGRIKSKDELLQAVEKNGWKMIQCADPSLLPLIELDEIEKADLDYEFRQEHCPSGIITSQEELLKALKTQREEREDLCVDMKQYKGNGGLVIINEFRLRILSWGWNNSPNITLIGKGSSPTQVFLNDDMIL